jgi:hypothetical protein
MMMPNNNDNSMLSLSSTGSGSNGSPLPGVTALAKSAKPDAPKIGPLDLAEALKDLGKRCLHSLM